MDSYNNLAAYYDKFTSDVPYEKWAKFYNEIFKKEGLEPKIVLDLACGTGSLAMIMSDFGYEIIGTDSSVEMLMQAMPKSYSAEKIPPIFLNQAMEDLDLYGTIDAVYSALDSVNYVIDKDTLLKAFKKVNLFLEPGGIFVFDINTISKLKRISGQSFVRDDEDVFCVWESDFSKETNLCTYNFNIFSRDENVWYRDEETHKEYAYSVNELEDLLTQAGFIDIKQYKELEFEMPDENKDDRIFFTARRKRA